MEKYIGVSPNRTRDGKRKVFRAKASKDGKINYLGDYDDAKAAAKAYDMFIIKNDLDRPTNFIKKRSL